MKKFYLAYLVYLSINQLHAQNQNLSNGNVFEGEPYVAINPVNSQNIVVAWMGFVFNSGSGLTIKVRSTFNGGLTWSTAVNMPHIVSTYQSADPSMAFDGNGKLFLAYIDHRENPDSGGVYLFKSVDGGLTWSNPVQVIDMYADGSKKPIDRPWLVINNSGDKLYLTTKPPSWVMPPNRPYFSASLDSGQTWQPWRYVDSTGYYVGSLIAAPMAVPACNENKVHVVYPSYVFSQNIYPQFIIATSANSGSTFSYHSVISGISTATNDTSKTAYKILEDPSDSNHLVFVYPYVPSGDIDIMITESFNGGVSWNTPGRVNDDAQGNGKMQDMLWAAFDTDGDLLITWRDRRNAPGSGYSAASEFFAAFRDKDSSQFSPNYAITDSIVAYNSILAQLGNDFMSAALMNDTLSAAWANTRDGSLDIWFVRMLASSGSITGISLIESESPLVSIYPNPSSGIFRIEMYNHSSIDEIRVLNIKNELILFRKVISRECILDLSAQPPGIYFIKIVSAGRTVAQKIVK